MVKKHRPTNITELADRLNLVGDLRVWFVQTAGLHPTFPRMIVDGILYADLDQVLAWFADQGLEHLLERTGFYERDDVAPDDDGQGDDGQDDDAQEQSARRRRR